MSECPICRKTGVQDEGAIPDADGTRWRCARCGAFEVTGVAMSAFLNKTIADFDKRRHLLSALARKAHEDGARLRIDEDLCGRVKAGQIREISVAEQLEKAMGWFAARSEYPGHRFQGNQSDDYPIAFCKDERAWNYVVRALIGGGYLELASQQLMVTPKGWEWVGDRPKAAGDRVFVAMSFADEMKDVRTAVCDAIRDAGYQPVIIDEDHYVGGVMDRVLARIRQSKFIVADFTGNRGGVYYEAGFAEGLGIKVIPTVREDHLDVKGDNHLHFDVRHINILPWTADRLDKLRDDLRERIEAIIGRGPHTTKERT